jgi:mannosyltransferase OCH1-like enzyme
MAENIYSLLKSNPEFDYYLYSDEKSAEYIRENFDEDVIYAFETLKPGAFKSDLWRYCVLYKTGGVYIDIKYNTVDTLVSLLENTPSIFVKDRDFFGNLKCVYNGLMTSPPENEIFKHCIDDVVRNCKLKLYNTTAVDVTGPCVLGRMLAKYEPETLKNIPYAYDVETDASKSHIDIIKYKNKSVLKSYPEYRSEQAQFQKTGRYTQMWMDKNIYN